LLFSDSQLISLVGDATNLTNTVNTMNIIDYIRGDRSNEAKSTLDTGFRARTSRLGDIISSSPYVVSSSKGHTVNREVVAFAANDGMVHIVDASDGKEVVAYIPSGVYDALGRYVDSSYIHEYSVDGGITAYSETDSATSSTTTTLVGRLGLGIAGLYAIDVSDMTNPTADMMKWEITKETTGFSGLGKSITAPTIVTLENGKASVIFANGYNASDKEGAIYIADLSDGSLIKKLSVGTQVDPTGADRPNALAQPALIDYDRDGIADHIYAGDLFGNLWVFDISSEDPADWDIKTVGKKPLFTAISPTLQNNVYMQQPITTRPSVFRDPSGTGVLVAFGTGQYVESDDNSAVDQLTQSFYVIADKLDTSVITAVRSANGFSNLQKQTITQQSSSNRLLSTNTVDWTTVNGFYLDFVNTEGGNTDNYGERQVVNSTVFDNKVSFVTLIPGTDPCVAGGTGWYMELNVYTGQTWYTGTPVVDDPSTSEDESQQIPTDSSNQFLEGVATGLNSLATVSTTTSTITNADGTTKELVSIDSVELQTCVTLANNKQVCFDSNSNLTGPISWRHLY
jgi:type IV pilus assembly protein PilY1